MTDAVRGSSREKLYQELGLEFLQQQRWFRKLRYFFKINKNQSPKYVIDKFPPPGEHTEQEIISTTFLDSISNIELVLPTHCN